MTCGDRATVMGVYAGECVVRAVGVAVYGADERANVDQ